ncbi:MAG: CRISPR system precrRNA processing endoribonuclease RAMP protein Cas6 [Pseudomonadota bacterium]|nr:CRISPR system precrRNA processing endoribonuclease RAMP protein Cas6 [Pseudomonadota bacterium]
MRIEFDLVCTSEHRFQPMGGAPVSGRHIDLGFKGSVWHNRLDVAFRSHPALANCRHRFIGDPTPVWVESPLDATDAQEPPFFEANPYPPRHAFQIALVLAGPLARESEQLLEPITRVVVDTGLHPEACRHGFFGGYALATLPRVRPWSAAPAQPFTVLEGHSVVLTLNFDTMMRVETRAQLREHLQGRTPIPRLRRIAESVLERAAALQVLPMAEIERLHRACVLAATIDTAPILRHNLHYHDVWRQSPGRGELQPIGGVIGAISYLLDSTAWTALQPVLRLGQWLRAGAKINLGLGRFRVRVEPAPRGESTNLPNLPSS